MWKAKTEYHIGSGEGIDDFFNFLESKGFKTRDTSQHRGNFGRTRGYIIARNGESIGEYSYDGWHDSDFLWINGGFEGLVEEYITTIKPGKMEDAQPDTKQSV